MKILQITSTFFPLMGGQERVIYEISKKLDKKGHKVTILTTDLFLDKKMKKKRKIGGIKIINLKNNFSLGGYGFSKKAMKWLKDNWKDYDVVHCHGYNRYLSEFAIPYLSGKIPVIFTPHGFVHTKKNYFFKIIHDATLGKFLRYADVCTALTKLDFKYYKKLGVKRKKIIEIPNGIDIKKFGKKNEKRMKKFKRKFGLDKNILLYVGRIHKSKGLQYVIKAIRDIDCKLVILGQDHGYKKELVHLINKLNIKKKVSFVGSLDDLGLIDAHQSSNALVLFSEWESFGVAPLEAMATGKPVIVSNRGSLPFLVEDKKEGFIVPFKNEKILREKIKYLFENKEKSRKMGLAGKKKAKNYDWENITNLYMNVYKTAGGS